MALLPTLIIASLFVGCVNNTPTATTIQKKSVSSSTNAQSAQNASKGHNPSISTEAKNTLPTQEEHHTSKASSSTKKQGAVKPSPIKPSHKEILPFDHKIPTKPAPIIKKSKKKLVWVPAETKQVWVDPIYETVEVPALYEIVTIPAVTKEVKTTKKVLAKEAWTETIKKNVVISLPDEKEYDTVEAWSKDAKAGKCGDEYKLTTKLEKIEHPAEYKNEEIVETVVVTPEKKERKLIKEATLENKKIKEGYYKTEVIKDGYWKEVDV